MLDGGRSLAPRAEGTERDLAQRRIKATLIAKGFRAGGIDAMALGASDWALGSGWVRDLARDESLPILAANLVCDGAAPFPSGVVLEQSGMRIGVVGVTEGVVEGCEVTDQRAALIAAVEALGPVDVRVGLVPVDTDRGMAALAAAVVEGVGGPPPLPLDLVIDARGRPPESGGELRGGTWWISGGQQGKKLGFLELSMLPGATSWHVEGTMSAGQSKADMIRSRLEGLERRLSAATDEVAKERLTRQKEAYQLQLAEAEALEKQAGAAGPRHLAKASAVELGTDVADHPVSLALVTASKQEITRLAGEDPRAFVPRLVDDVSSPYAGGETCVRCHDQQHAQWSTTPHARAWNGLVNVERAFDEACWSCHVTGAKVPGGPAEARLAGAFRDVQCEACHGAGRLHVADPKTAVIPIADPGVETCVGCHDGAQDQGRFDGATYLPQVVHTPPKP